VPVVMSINSRSSISATLTGAGSEGSADPGTAAPADDSGQTDPAARPAPAAQPAPSTGHARAAVVAAEAAAAPSTELAVAVYDRVTRESAVGDRGTEPFMTASLAKVVVAVDILDRRRMDGLVITQSDISLLRRALSLSDDSAMNALWTKFDGQGAAGRVRGRLGLTGTSAPKAFGQWGEMNVPAVD